ncbi:GspE/PulE family protein [Patescibacteria group bacterium]
MLILVVQADLNNSNDSQSISDLNNSQQQSGDGIEIGEKTRQFEESQARIEAQGAGLPYINLYGFPVRPETLALVSKEDVIEHEIVPFLQEGQTVRLATPNPKNPGIQDILKNIQEEKGFTTDLYLVSRSSYDHVIEAYQAPVEKRVDERGKVMISDEDLKKFQKTIKSLKDIEETFKKISTTDLIALIVAGALQVKASDIHIEKQENDVRLRYRIDGILQDVAILPDASYKPINSRIKLVSKLKMNVTDVPQDGRFTINVENRETDVRVSTIPSTYGEAIVMRLLGIGAVSLIVDDLGFIGRSREIIENELKKPNGMILTTGPTGSGKTTTLYSFVNTLNSPEVKIITLEDPIEYRLKGIQQTQVEHETGYDFASGLRAILRQDPDIVLVGEIRDLETAEIAAQAALTGHVVFSTLHTNDAAGALPRLINMGLKPFIIAPAINAVIGQRLVRRVCEECQQVSKESAKIIEDIKKDLGSDLIKDLPKDLKIVKGKGCNKCNNTGYRGRIGIYEVFTIDDRMEKLIMKEAGTAEMRDAAIASGMITMRQDGLLKVLQGITTLEEVDRVT